MSWGAGSRSPFVEMGFIRMRRVRGLDSWVGGWSQPGRGLDQERVQELPGHTWQAGMETGAESWAGAGENQGPHGDGGPDPEEQRRRTVGGSVTSGVRTSWAEMSEEGWGVAPSHSGHARSRSQMGRPSCRTTEAGPEAQQPSRRIDVENPLSERLDPAFAIGARRIPKNTSLALTLQIEDHFSDLRALWSWSESIRP